MTYRCERCGARFSPIRVSNHQNCPRCRARDRVSVPLTLEMGPFAGLREGDGKGDRSMIDPEPD
jgi:hypothetical protein